MVLDGLCRLRSISSLYYGWRSGRSGGGSGGGDGSADADEWFVALLLMRGGRIG